MKLLRIMPPLRRGTTAALIASALFGLQANAQNGAPPPAKDFPPYKDVFEGYREVVSRGSTNKSLLSLWVRDKDGQVLAALPAKFDKLRFYIALTIASGERYAGLQAGELYGYWRRYDKTLAFIEPNLEIRSNGDQESRSSIQRLFTDRVIVDVPIKTMLPKWGPVIDLDELLVKQASAFFGTSAVRGIQPRLASIKTSEAFPDNVEVAFEVPVAGGQLKTLHYSISVIPANTGYKPRKADERVGYFTTHYSDLGEYEDETRVRYINRWHLEKADKSLKVSPPKNPITFYIEHTTPIRYRRWVRHGILMWNKAYENVGIANAIEVHYQDGATGAHMDKHPEDVRWNFVRWLNNNVGTAIGPSRVDPNTGQILDADIILTDGWIRHYWDQFNRVLPDLAVEGFTPKTLAWLDQHPQWDPRLRLAPPAQRNHLLEERRKLGARPYGGHPMAQPDATLYGDNEYDGLNGHVSQINGLCRAADCKAIDMALMRFNFDLLSTIAETADGEGEAKDEEKLDGIPEWFVGPLIAELVAHEVGHTIGLRHNFKASSIYTLAEINSDEVKDKKPFAGSVMDYLPINMFMEKFGEKQGDYSMIDIGPYDMWAIEYGYSMGGDDDLKKILARSAEPELTYGTDEDTSGPDPFARRYDFGADPVNYARSQMELVKLHRSRLLDKFVEDGDSWAKARSGYEMTLAVQQRSLSMMANWLGGSTVNRQKKGDPNASAPIAVVDADRQREALNFVMENAFFDEAFGLTPELLRHLTIDKWWDDRSTVYQDSTWPVHDRLSGIQSSVLTMLLNPSTLERVYDNEFITPRDQDMITLPEVMASLHDCIWKELSSDVTELHTARKPLISSLRRVLQSEYLLLLIDLALYEDSYSVSSKPISDLAAAQLRRLSESIADLKKRSGNKIDAYSSAHLDDALQRITKALDAQYIYNANQMGGSGGAITILLGADGQPITP